MNCQVILAISTCPDAATARRIAEALVTERLVTCVNRVAGVRSTYLWEGQLQDDEEVLLLMKTTHDRLASLTQRVKDLHPYELPELIATPITGGNERYLDWLRQHVHPEAQ